MPRGSVGYARGPPRSRRDRVAGAVSQICHRRDAEPSPPELRLTPPWGLQGTRAWYCRVRKQMQSSSWSDACGVCDPTAFRLCGAFFHMSERRVTASDAGFLEVRGLIAPI